MLVTVLAILGAAHAACDQPFVHALFVPPEGANRVPAATEIAVAVYGDFGIDYDIWVDADGKEVGGQITPLDLQDARPDPGGIFLFDPYEPLDTEALHTIHLLYDKDEVASSTFEVTTESILPLTTIPLVDITSVTEPIERNDTCGARTVRDVSIDLYPAAGDPLAVSYLELHLIPPGNGVNDDTIYDLIPVPADLTPVQAIVEVPADTAGDYCLSATQSNGSGGDPSGAATIVCVQGFLPEPDEDEGCGCSHATPMGGALSMMALALVAARRRSNREA